MTLPWYKEGLRFKCTGCGRCCTGGPGYVWLEDEDIVRLSKALRLSPEDFVRQYVRRIGERLSLKEVKRGEAFDCIFLEGKQCRVYQDRPTQCRKYPWWPQNLENEAAWQEAAVECEGINHPAAPLVTFEEIEKQR